MVNQNFAGVGKGWKSRLIVGAIAVLLLVLAVATIGIPAAQVAEAPDCSTVTYNGEGTETNPYEVSDIDQLQCIEEQSLDANYVQVSNIDASDTSAWNGGDGFEPIGELNPDGDTEFTGTFDGGGSTITGLTIDRGDEDNVGLFGGNNGHITTVGLEDVEITGGERVGGLVGGNGFGTVEDSYATGDVTGDLSVGGLAGQNFGTVEGSYATGDVTGDINAGGLVGFHSTGIVKDSYATGTVTGGSNVGGLIGLNNKEVEASYSSGDVTGESPVGGLVGANTNEATTGKSYATGDVEGDSVVGGLAGQNMGAVTESYSTGAVNYREDDDFADDDDFGDFDDDVVVESHTTDTVTGDGDLVGGLIAFNLGSVTDSYWDTEATGQDDSDGGTGLTTSEMTGSAAPNNMDGFDFKETWETVTNPDDYPVLVWETEDEPAPPNVVDDYRNEQGDVDTGGLQDAIGDFIGGDIGTGDLQEVITAFIAN